MLLQIIVIILLMLLLSAFFSGMEIAFTSKNRLKLEIDRKQSRVFGYIADVFARHPGQYLTTILVGNNIALVVFSLSMTTLIQMGGAYIGSETIANGSTLLETAISTVIVIFVAEFLPKSIFRTNPNFYYRHLTPVLLLFYIALYPIAKFTTILSHAILHLFGRKVEHNMSESSFDRADIISLLDASSLENSQEADNDIKIFQNALDFSDLRVRDCMVPRVDIEGVDVDNASLEELSHKFIDTMFTRILIWEGSIDNIVGYVNSKSMFKSPNSIREVIRKVNYVPETMPLQLVLQNFIKHKNNIAVVIDEFGGTAGIISIEDVLEQIFGEIEDEHDVSELTDTQITDDEWILSCRFEVKYLNEKYGLNIEESRDYDTLAGYIIYNYDGIPELNQTILIGNLEFKILRTTRSRIVLTRVKKL